MTDAETRCARDVGASLADCAFSVLAFAVLGNTGIAVMIFRNAHRAMM
jgi:hypothetical protein